MNTDELMRVVQLPIIDEEFQLLADEINKKTSDALAMVCTEETVKDVKKVRAELNKQFQDLEDRRKAVKKAISEPYNVFEKKYKEFISNAYKSADSALKCKIDDVENGLKKQCEDELREYFDELCIVYHIDWLKFEQLNIKIDIASAKSKNRTKLRNELKERIEAIESDLDLISGMEHENSILARYRDCLNFAESVCYVRKFYERIEQIKKNSEKRKQEKESETEEIKKVEAFSAPTVAEEKITVSFKVTGTKSRLILLKNWLEMNGYDFE